MNLASAPENQLRKLRRDPFSQTDEAIKNN